MASYPPPPPPPGSGPSQGPPPPSGYGVPQTFYVTSIPTNSKAIAALVCGIAGLFLTCFPISIAAVILGPMAKKEIAAGPELYQGTGLAWAGQIIGWIGLALNILVILFVLVVIIIAAASESDTSFESLAPLASLVG